MASSSSSLTIQEAAQVMNFCRETEEVGVLGAISRCRRRILHILSAAQGFANGRRCEPEFNKIDENTRACDSGRFAHSTSSMER